MVQATSLRTILDIFRTNGELYVGLAAGADKALTNECKLATDEKDDTIQKRVDTALSHIAERFVTDPVVRKFFQHGVIAIYAFDLKSSSGHDFRMVTGRGKQNIDVTVDVKLVETALFVILSTKVNLYAINHHVGQGSLIGYAKKVYDTVVRPLGISSTEAASVMHTLGHYADTCKVFSLFGLKNVKNYTRVRFSPSCCIVACEDITLRIGSFPAGTSGLAAAFAICRKIIKHPLYPIIRDDAAVRDIARKAKNVLADPLSYHIGSRAFYSGKKSLIDLSSRASFIDRLLCFQKILYPKSTLSKSRAIPEDLSDLEHYDQGWVGILQRFATDFNVVDKRVYEKLIKNLPTEAVALTPKEIAELEAAC